LGENPLKLDSKPPTIPFQDYALKETRFRMLLKANPERAKTLLANAQRSVQARFDVYKQLATLQFGSTDAADETH
jgi:pyruvate-ferredoxin/flavodoxin oxidoreductase